MVKPPRFWVSAAPDPRILVPRQPRRCPVAAAPLPVHASALCQGVELAGPSVLRAAVRVPLPQGTRTSEPGRCRWVGAVHVRWLDYMGLSAATLYEGPPVAHWASFGARRHGDVVVRGRKITSVVELRRPGESVLVASTLLGPAPWSLLCQGLQVAAEEAASLDQLSVTVAECVPGKPDVLTCSASLRALLHLSLRLAELQMDAYED